MHWIEALQLEPLECIDRAGPRRPFPQRPAVVAEWNPDTQTKVDVPLIAIGCPLTHLPSFLEAKGSVQIDA